MRFFAGLVLLCFVSIFAAGQAVDIQGESPSRLRGMIERFGEDYGAFNRFYTAYTSTNRAVKMKMLYSDYLSELNKQNFDSLSHDEQVDYVLFKNYLDHELKELSRGEAQLGEMSALIPFAKTISVLKTRGGVWKRSMGRKRRRF